MKSKPKKKAVKSAAPVCPKCNSEYYEPPALSREDNSTNICPSCGIREAFQSIAALRRSMNGDRA